MSQGSRQYVFELEVADIDRGVYESLSLKVSRHASETDAFLVTRVLAYALRYEEGIAFSGGIAASDEPAVWTRDLTGQLRTWIDIGTPDATRLHKAGKAADAVFVYCHKQVDAWLRGLRGSRIHRSEQVGIVELDRSFIATVAEALQRRNRWSLSLTEGELYLEIEGESYHTTLVPHSLEG